MDAEILKGSNAGRKVMGIRWSVLRMNIKTSKIGCL